MDFSPKDFFARNPEISYLFNPNMLENLLADSNSPFAHDQEYLLTQGALFILLEEINNTRAFVKADYRFSMNKSIDFSQVQEHLDLLSQLKNYVVNMSSQRLTAIAGGGFIPRTVRLVERLEFTQKESWALGYMVLYYSDSDFYNRFQMHDSLGDLGCY